MKKYSLLLVAHPDDETIFFGGLLQVYRRRPWKVVCITDGNADGLKSQRQREFESACSLFKVKACEMWDFPDRYGARLDVEALVERIKKESPAEVFTHGILGEYGHPHHQDVSLAAHRAFHGKIPVWSVAYNCQAQKTIRLPNKAYRLKCQALSQIYFSETNRFARWLPALQSEGFTQLKLTEVETLYAFLTGQSALPALERLHSYSWFQPYLEEFRRQIQERPF